MFGDKFEDTFFNNFFFFNSRDQQFLDKIINESVINLLVEKADLGHEEHVHSKEDFEGKLYLNSVKKTNKFKSIGFNAGISEAQKCIFNLVFSHVKSRELFTNTCAAKSILRRLSNSEAIPHEVLFFDLKILFLISALCSDFR